jgi:hypothetical protein
MPDKDIDKQGIAKRLTKLMEALGFKNERQWAIAMGYDRPDNLYNATKGVNMPGVPLLTIISNKFENANIGWVLSGRGVMLFDNEKSGTPKAPDLNLLTQIENYANGILFSLHELKQEPHGVFQPGTNVIPAAVQTVKALDKKKTDKRLRGK